MMTEKKIYITEFDRMRLEELIKVADEFSNNKYIASGKRNFE